MNLNICAVVSNELNQQIRVTTGDTLDNQRNITKSPVVAQKQSLSFVITLLSKHVVLHMLFRLPSFTTGDVFMPQKKNNPDQNQTNPPATTNLVAESIRQGTPAASTTLVAESIRQGTPAASTTLVAESIRQGTPAASTTLVAESIRQGTPAASTTLVAESIRQHPAATTNLVAESIQQGAQARPRSERFVGESVLVEFGQQLLRTEPNPNAFSGTLGQMLYEDRLRERLQLPPHSSDARTPKHVDRVVGEQGLRDLGQEILRTAPNKNIFSGTLGQMFYEDLLRERLQVPLTNEPRVEPERRCP